MLKGQEYKIHPNHMSKQVCTRIVGILSPENAQPTQKEVNMYCWLTCTEREEHAPPGLL